MANPGRDCPEVSLKRTNRSFTTAGSDKIGEMLQDILKPRNEIMTQFDQDSWADFQQGKFSEKGFRPANSPSVSSSILNFVALFDWLLVATILCFYELACEEFENFSVHETRR